MDITDLESQLGSLNIIVVDDEPIARMVLTKGLKKCGYKSMDSASCWPSCLLTKYPHRYYERRKLKKSIGTY